MGRIEQQNRARLGNDRVDALKAKNAQFQAAKKAGTLKQFRKDNPKMSGADRAKAMAKAMTMAMMRSPLLPRPATNTPAAANTLRARFKTPGVTPSRYVGPAVTPSRYADYQGDKYNLLTVLGKGAFGLVTLMRRADDGAR